MPCSWPAASSRRSRSGTCRPTSTTVPNGSCRRSTKRSPATTAAREVFVAYADCGTGGALDAFVDERAEHRHGCPAPTATSSSPDPTCSPRCTTPSRARSTSPTSWPSTSMRSCGRGSGSTATPSCATRTSATTGVSCCCRSPTIRAVVEAGRAAAAKLGLDVRARARRTPRPFAEAVGVVVSPAGRADAARRARAPEVVVIYWRDIPAQVNGQSAATATRCCCRPSSSAPSIGPSARRASTPPTRTSPSGVATSEPCDGDHRGGRRGAGGSAREASTRATARPLAFAGGFESDVGSDRVRTVELAALEELEDEGASDTSASIDTGEQDSTSREQS